MNVVLTADERRERDERLYGPDRAWRAIGISAMAAAVLLLASVLLGVIA